MSAYFLTMCKQLPLDHNLHNQYENSKGLKIKVWLIDLKRVRSLSLLSPTDPLTYRSWCLYLIDMAVEGLIKCQQTNDLLEFCPGFLLPKEIDAYILKIC